MTIKKICQMLMDHGLCGCSEIGPVVDIIGDCLDACEKGFEYVTINIFGNEKEETGIYYLVFGMLENMDLIEHGTSIRYPWLTDIGNHLHNPG